MQLCKYSRHTHTRTSTKYSEVYSAHRNTLCTDPQQSRVREELAGPGPNEVLPRLPKNLRCHSAGELYPPLPQIFFVNPPKKEVCLKLSFEAISSQVCPTCRALLIDIDEASKENRRQSAEKEQMGRKHML